MKKFNKNTLLRIMSAVFAVLLCFESVTVSYAEGFDLSTDLIVIINQEKQLIRYFVGENTNPIFEVAISSTVTGKTTVGDFRKPRTKSPFPKDYIYTSAFLNDENILYVGHVSGSERLPFGTLVAEQPFNGSSKRLTISGEPVFCVTEQGDYCEVCDTVHLYCDECNSGLLNGCVCVYCDNCGELYCDGLCYYCEICGLLSCYYEEVEEGEEKHVFCKICGVYDCGIDHSVKKPFLKGDVNGDGRISRYDADEIIYYLEDEPSMLDYYKQSLEAAAIFGKVPTYRDAAVILHYLSPYRCEEVSYDLSECTCDFCEKCYKLKSICVCPRKQPSQMLVKIFKLIESFKRSK